MESSHCLWDTISLILLVSSDRNLSQEENNGKGTDLLVHVIRKSSTEVIAGMAGSRSSNYFCNRVRKLANDGK